MKYTTALLTFISIILCSGASYTLYSTYFTPPQIVVVIPSYNNIAWYKKNLDMLRAQQYPYWRAVYVDDCSPDGTGAAVERYVAHHGLGNKVTVIKNKQRCGALANFYNTIHTLKDRDIVVVYDGDDWFAHEWVLTKVADAYKDPSVWLTYGQYKEYPERNIGGNHIFPQKIIEANAFRKYPWISSHLRTFYAGLFKKIKKEDLLHNGDFFEKTGDLAAMFPMLEMAGNRIKRMNEILYVYNLDNPINDWKEDLDLMMKLDRYIRGKRPYERLACL